MVWLDEDSGTVSSRLSQTDEMYGQGFVAYLARFLLNYDEDCREYFNGKLDVVVPRRDGSEIWDEFRVCICCFDSEVFVAFSRLFMLMVQRRLEWKGGRTHGIGISKA